MMTAPPAGVPRLLSQAGRALSAGTAAFGLQFSSTRWSSFLRSTCTGHPGRLFGTGAQPLGPLLAAQGQQWRPPPPEGAFQPLGPPPSPRMSWSVAPRCLRALAALSSPLLCPHPTPCQQLFPSFLCVQISAVCVSSRHETNTPSTRYSSDGFFPRVGCCSVVRAREHVCKSDAHTF